MATRKPVTAGSNPVPEIAEGKRRYRKVNNMMVPYKEPDYSQAVIPWSQSRRIGQAYVSMPHHDPEALPAYHAMREETGRQFDFLTRPRSRGGLGIDVSVHDTDPYPSTGRIEDLYPELAHDVREHGHIGVLSTRSTGGHPVFTNDENDQFRAVHDVFGHLGSGRSVDAHGEDAAFQAHASMYSPLARRAMATETRGQNAALHLTGEFQPQKVGVLPAKYQRPTNLQPLQFEDPEQLQAEGRAENIKHGVIE